MSTITRIPSLVLGERTFVGSDITNMKYFYGRCNTGISKYATLRLFTASGGYVVTGGTTLTIYGVRIMSAGSSGHHGGLLGYGDTDVGMSSASAPTNPVYMAGETAGVVGFSAVIAATYGASSPSVLAVNFSIPAGKYPFIVTDGSSSGGAIFNLWGIEA